MEETEFAVIRKLLQNRHINVEERKAFPGGKLRRSAAVAVIEEGLRSTGEFPHEGNSKDSCRIERSPEGRYLLHLKYETGMMRFESLTEEFASEKEVIDQYLKALGSEDSRASGPEIDGISIVDE